MTIDYMPAKKWLWEREAILPGGVACRIITKEHLAQNPFSNHEWSKVPDSGVEE